MLLFSSYVKKEDVKDYFKQFINFQRFLFLFLTLAILMVSYSVNSFISDSDLYIATLWYGIKVDFRDVVKVFYFSTGLAALATLYYSIYKLKKIFTENADSKALDNQLKKYNKGEMVRIQPIYKEYSKPSRKKLLLILLFLLPWFFSYTAVLLLDYNRTSYEYDVKKENLKKKFEEFQSTQNKQKSKPILTFTEEIAMNEVRKLNEVKEFTKLVEQRENKAVFESKGNECSGTWCITIVVSEDLGENLELFYNYIVSWINEDDIKIYRYKENPNDYKQVK